MNGPPDAETPGTGVATGPSVEMEKTVEAYSETDDNSASPDALGEMTNVVLFRPFRRGHPHPFEIVETFRFDRTILVAVAGPWTASPLEGGQRKPWQKIAMYPIEDASFAAARAEMLAEQMGIPVVDLAGITASPHPLVRPDGPGAA